MLSYRLLIVYSVLQKLLFVPATWKYHGQWWRIFSYVLIHRSVVHLLTNVAILLVMGWAYEPHLDKFSWVLMLAFITAVASLAQFPKTIKLHPDESNDYTAYSGFSNVNSGLIVAALLTGDIHAIGIPISRMVVALYFLTCIINLPLHRRSIVDHQGHFFGACAGLLMYKLNLVLI
jgi:membrane associated rhomboid family serine protease